MRFWPCANGFPFNEPSLGTDYNFVAGKTGFPRNPAPHYRRFFDPLFNPSNAVFQQAYTAFRPLRGKAGIF